MHYLQKPTQFTPIFRVLSAFICFCFLNSIIAPEVSAQVNVPSNLVMPSDAFAPASLKAIHFDPKAPFEIDFIIDSADQSKVDQKAVNKLVQYFLAAMTTPEKDMWVNLSPYETKRIIAPQFGKTSAGRELLAQDQILKQLAASLTYPESGSGKEFWSRVYQKAIAVYGTTAIPIDTFQRVWIMPQKAVVYEHNGTAFITERRLKVLLEDDYVALKKTQTEEGSQRLSESEAQEVSNFSATITREIILPEIEKEINEGENFAALRQVFDAIILATWFKKKLKTHILSRLYVDRKKVKGIEDDSEQTAEKIYQQYVRVLEEGVYNYVRGDYDAPSQSVISRQYFSGGFSVGQSEKWLDIRPLLRRFISSKDFLTQLGEKLLFAKIRWRPLGIGGALQLPISVSAISSPNLSTPITPIAPLPSVPPSVGTSYTGSVLKVSANVVEALELVNFYIDKFANILKNAPDSQLLVFLRGPVQYIKDKAMLKKAGAIEKAAVYIIEGDKLNIIDAQGNIGAEVASSAVLAGGLVLVVSPTDEPKVRYFDAALIEKKTGRSPVDQLAGHRSDKATAAAGGPDKKGLVAGGPKDPLAAVNKKTGGVDMQVENNLEIQGEDSLDWGTFLIPEMLLQEMQGMDFEILELTPVINPPLFIPDFVQGHTAAPQQLFSFTMPPVDSI